MRSSLKSHVVDKDTTDIDRELSKIKKRLLQKYLKVFKDELDKHDRLKIDPIKIELIDDYREVRSTNHMIPFSTPCHRAQQTPQGWSPGTSTQLTGTAAASSYAGTPIVDKRPKHTLSVI